MILINSYQTLPFLSFMDKFYLIIDSFDDFLAAIALLYLFYY